MGARRTPIGLFPGSARLGKSHRPHHRAWIQGSRGSRGNELFEKRRKRRKNFRFMTTAPSMGRPLLTDLPEVAFREELPADCTSAAVESENVNLAPTDTGTETIRFGSSARRKHTGFRVVQLICSSLTNSNQSPFNCNLSVGPVFREKGSSPTHQAE